MGNWTAGGSSQNWAITTDQELFENINFPVPSGTHFLSDSPSANYPSNKDYWIALNHDINLTGHSEELYVGFGAAVWLSQNSDGSISDYANVEVSKDGGNNWISLFNMGVYACYFQQC